MLSVRDRGGKNEFYSAHYLAKADAILLGHLCDPFLHPACVL